MRLPKVVFPEEALLAARRPRWSDLEPGSRVEVVWEDVFSIDSWHGKDNEYGVDTYKSLGYLNYVNDTHIAIEGSENLLNAIVGRTLVLPVGVVRRVVLLSEERTVDG